MSRLPVTQKLLREANRKIMKDNDLSMCVATQELRLLGHVRPLGSSLRDSNRLRDILKKIRTNR